MLNQAAGEAASSGEDFVFLKLDVVKAFDRLEWPFLLRVLDKAGRSGLLDCFLQAGFASASSFVMLNGRASGRATLPIALKRFVRQGCPLSPLLFILAFDVLGALFQRALDTKAI